MPTFEVIFSPVFVRGLWVFHGLRGLTGFGVATGTANAKVAKNAEGREGRQVCCGRW
jgi:hypothetical protein